MRPLTYTEEQTLGSWNFLNDYDTYRVELVHLAVQLYARYSGQWQMQVGKDLFVDIYKGFLRTNAAFITMLASKQTISADQEEFYADLIARRVIDKEWRFIISPLSP